MALELMHASKLPAEPNACSWCSYNTYLCASQCTDKARAQGLKNPSAYFLIDTLKFITWRLKK